MAEQVGPWGRKPPHPTGMIAHLPILRKEILDILNAVSSLALLVVSVLLLLELKKKRKE